MGARNRIRRFLRVTGIVGGVVLGVAIVAVLLLLIRPMREIVLHSAIQIASDSLPGEIEYRSADWPGLSRLELREVTWRDGEDLLAGAEGVFVDVDLRALARKDVHVRTLVLDGVEADVPRIQVAMETLDAPAGEGDPPAFPREGSLPAVPSVGIDSLQVDVVRVVAAPDVDLTLSAGLALDLRSGHTPTLSLRSLDGSWIQRGWGVRSDGLDVALETAEFGGSLAADFSERGAVDLTLETTGPRAFRLLVLDRGEAEPLLQLDGTFTQTSDGMLETLDYAVELRAPEPARIEQALQRPGAVDPVVPLGEMRVHAEGRLEIPETVRGEAAVVVSASNWDGELEVRLRHEGPRVDLDELAVTGNGLSVQASGSYETGSYTAEVEALVSGTDFLAGMVESEGIPGDLRARLRLEVAGEQEEVRPSAQLTASAHSAGVDSLRLDAYGRIAGPDSDLRLDLQALVRERIAIGVDARVRDLDQPRAHLAPVRVRDSLAQLAANDGALPERPNLLLDPRTRRIEVDGLRITGDLGEVQLDADVSDSLGGSGTLRIEWPVPPAALDLAGFDAAARDSLLAPHWSADGTPGIDLQFALPRGAQTGTVDATLALPAPWTVVAGLDSAAYDAPQLLGSVEGEWSASGSWTAALDFAATAWLDSAFVHAHGEAGTTHLDSLLVRGGPLRATAAADLDSTSIEGKFQLDLHSHPALANVLPDLPPDLEFMLNLRAGISGSPDAPDARAKLLATARSPLVRMPLLTAEAEVVESVPQSVRIEIPQRSSIGGFRIERALVAARPEDPEAGLFPLWIASEVDGDAQWSHSALVDSLDNSWRVASDSLRIGARGHILSSLRPFTFEFAPADSALRLDGLELAGAPGQVAASFDLGPGRARADIDAHVDGSIVGALVRTPQRMLPTGYHLVAKGDQDDLAASFRVEGITLGSRRDIVASIDSRRVGEQVEVQVHAHDALGRLARGEVVLPMRLDLVNRQFEWYDGPLTGTVDVDSLPLPYRIGGDQGLGSYLLGNRDETAPLADGQILLGGTGHQPVVGAQVGVGFPGIEELQGARLLVGGIWIGREGDPAPLDLLEPESLERLRRILPYGGIAFGGALQRDAQQLATIRGGFPLGADAISPFPGFGPGDPVIFSVTAEPLRLNEWQAIMPRGSEIGGELWLTASGEGPIGDFPLEASMRMKNLFFRQSFGNSATLNGQIDVRGRSSAPDIRGVIKVPSALVVLPENGRDLHPVKGNSRLWDLGLVRRDEFAALDSLNVEWGWAFDVEDSVETGEPRLTLAESTQLDVKIEIPNSFWIRGQGLQVQLSGELNLALRDGLPIVVGELRALSGTLEVVGARLQLDRGIVTFYGGDTGNPSLDLELSRTRGDVRVIVRVTGTALEPRLTFDSDPPMSQSDIMSYLIFGSSADDLDGAQTQLLQDQAAAALSQFAAPMLENELTQSLGISMMQLQAGEDPDDGLSLVVGKYVTPQILLKYEQSLKDRQKYTVNAEYWLTRNLRIETRLSETRSTGIELNWGTDY